jgi:hydrogenase expression/formation protein HypC
VCVAFPMRISSIDGLEAKAEAGGVSRTVSLWLTPEAGVGDYVYVHAGYAISLVDEDAALETLRLLRQLVQADNGDDLVAATDDELAVRGPNSA